MNRQVAILAAAAALALQGTLVAVAADEKPVTVKLNAMNGSGETGTMTLTPKGETTVVTLSMSPASKDAQPAHFHDGTCDKYAPKPKYPLKNVVEGKSTTTLEVPMAKLLAGDMVVNVHKSAAEIATISSCAVAAPAK